MTRGISYQAAEAVRGLSATSYRGVALLRDSATQNMVAVRVGKGPPQCLAFSRFRPEPRLDGPFSLLPLPGLRIAKRSKPREVFARIEHDLVRRARRLVR